jgi:hypothetical protein
MSYQKLVVIKGVWATNDGPLELRVYPEMYVFGGDGKLAYVSAFSKEFFDRYASYKNVSDADVTTARADPDRYGFAFQDWSLDFNKDGPTFELKYGEMHSSTLTAHNLGEFRDEHDLFDVMLFVPNTVRVPEGTYDKSMFAYTLDELMDDAEEGIEQDLIKKLKTIKPGPQQS